MKKTVFIIALVASVLMVFGPAFGAGEEDFQRAVDHYKAGRYEEAVRLLGEYVEERPEGSAYYLMGYANYALGRHDEAARNFKDAYLVDPEFSPGEFRREIGIDEAAPPMPSPGEAKAPPEETMAPLAVEAPAQAEEAAPAKAPEAAAPPPKVSAATSKAPAEAEAPPKRAAPEPGPTPRPRPSPPPPPKPSPTAFLFTLGILPLVAGLALYLYYAVCLFLIARKTSTPAPWLAFVPVVNTFWPFVGASGKPAWWMALLLVPVVNIVVAVYIWMLISERLGKGKVFGLLIALVPVVNLVLLGLLAFRSAPAAPAFSGGLELPELPGAGGMRETGPPSFEEETPAAGPVEAAAPPEEALFEESPGMEKKEEQEFGDLLAETEEVPEEFQEEVSEEEPAEEEELLEELYAEEPREEGLEPLEELPPEEEIPPEEEAPGEKQPPFEERALPPGSEAAPHEGAEPWEIPEEEPLEYEKIEEPGEGAPPPAGGGAGLMDVGELLKKTWGVFKRRVLTLVLVFILSGLVFAVGFGIFFGAGMLLGMLLEPMKEGLVAGGVVAGVIAGLIAWGWGYGALVCAVADESLGVVEAYRRAWLRVGSFIWIVVLLYLIIIPGGYFLFLVPGVLFTVWFSFGPFVLAGEGEAGMSAIIKSKEYVRGHFGDVLVRFLVIWALSIGIWMVQQVFHLASLAIPLVPTLASVALSLVFTPFSMIFIYLVYRDLRRLKGEVAYSAGGGEKAKWLGLGILGWLLGPIVLLVLAALTGMAVMGSMFMAGRFQF